MTRPTLSVIIITKNEATLIERCLESVKWADEIRQILVIVSIQGYEFLRLFSCCSRFMQHSSWWSVLALKLFMRNKESFTNNQTYGYIQINIKINSLQKILLHYRYRLFDRILQKINHHLYENLLAPHTNEPGAGMFITIHKYLWSFIKFHLRKIGF